MTVAVRMCGIHARADCAAARIESVPRASLDHAQERRAPTGLITGTHATCRAVSHANIYRPSIPEIIAAFTRIARS